MGAAAVQGEGDLPRRSGLQTRALFKLENGLNVVLEENHAAPVVAAQVWVHVGAADDPPGQEGIAHLFQHLLFMSTKTRPAGQFGHEIAAVGGRMGAWTSYDETVLHAMVASPFVDLGLGLLADALREATLAPSDLDVAVKAARSDLRQTAGAPDRVAAAAALETAFGSHSHGRSLMGTEASLAAMTVGGVRAFFDRFYGAANTTLVVVGDFDPATIRGQVIAAFGPWRAGTIREARAREPEQTAPRISVSTADVPTPILVVAFRTPDVRDRDVPALELLAAVLGPGRGGRLDVEVARNRALVTAPRASLFTSRQGGLLVTTATLGPGRVDEAARAVLDEMLRLSRERVGPEELGRARTVVEGDGAADKASLDSYARKLGLFAAATGDAGFETAYLERLGKLDADDLREVAARTFRVSNVTIAVVLPIARDPGRDDRAAKLMPRLRAIAAATAEHPTMPIAKGPVSASGRDVADYVLPSGVRLLVLPDDSASQVSVRAVWSGGIRFEDARLAGATTLLARLLPRGSKTRGVEQLATELGEIAGSIDGIAGIDMLGLKGDFLGSRWEHGIELLVDCLRNPRFSDEEIERERRVVLDAIRFRDDDPTELAQRLFQEALFVRHPYRQDLLGTADAVAGLNRRRLLDHYRQHYTPRSLTIAVVGAVDPDRVAAKIQSLFADATVGASDTSTRGTEQPRVLPRASEIQSEGAGQVSIGEPREVCRFIPKAQARVVLGYPGITVQDPDRFALEVLAEILGGSGGRLATLRELRGLADTVAASAREGVDPGYFSVTVATRPDTVDALVASLRAELARVVETGVTADEVARARRILAGTRALALERRGAVAFDLALHAAFGEVGRFHHQGVDELLKVTVEDVIRVARRIINPGREILAVVRPRDPGRPLTSMFDARSRYSSR